MANLECHLSLFLADFLMKVYRQVCLFMLFVVLFIVIMTNT